MDDADAIAGDLFDAHRTAKRFEPFAAARGVAGLDDAYAVQDRLVARLIGSGGEPVGFKIGLTSARMQAMCGIDQPIGGVVLGRRVHPSGATLSRAGYGRLGLEFEIGVRLGRDLEARTEPRSLDEMADAIDGVCAAAEVIDDRAADYARLDVLSLVCDNSWNAGAVLGEFRPPPPDLAALEGVVRENGVEVDRGTGRDVLGHPLRPLAWLADHLGRRCRGLRRGEVVLTGSLVTTRFPGADTAYEFELSGAGSVAMTIGA